MGRPVRCVVAEEEVVEERVGIWRAEMAVGTVLGGGGAEEVGESEIGEAKPVVGAAVGLLASGEL